MKVLYFLFCLIFLSVYGGESFYRLRSREGAGMFSTFGDVLGLLEAYDRGTFRGIEVDFATEGPYYDPDHGPNWWNYYCYPLVLGERKDCPGRVYSDPALRDPLNLYTDRKYSASLIQKYIRFRPDILETVQNFVDAHFGGHFVFGIHYRGTDAPHSSPPFPIIRMQIQEVVREMELVDYRLFIASDEQPFVDSMKEAFPGRVCCQMISRSQKGGPALHLFPRESRYQQGREALIDCLLLSNCSSLLLAYSNLSVWAALFNPSIPYIDMSKKLPKLN